MKYIRGNKGLGRGIKLGATFWLVALVLTFGSKVRALSFDEKLNRIIIPSVEFQDTPLIEALAFLRQRSLELDLNEPDPSKKGINIILNGGTPNSDKKITLQLKNVSMATALKYTTAMAQVKYLVEPHAVLVVPLNWKAPVKAGEGKAEKSDSRAVKDLVSKVVFKARRQQNYTLEFVALPDADRFQVIRHATSKYKRATFIMRLGEESADRMIKVDGYDQREELNKLGVLVDMSELSITHLPDGRTFELVKRMKQVIPTFFGQFGLVKGEDFFVKKGDSFRLPGDPGAEYKLVDIDTEKAVISIKLGQGKEVEVEIRK